MNSMVPITPQVGTRSGDWVWDGARWVCDPDDFPQPCPPQCPPNIVTPAFFPPPVFSGPTAQPPWYPGANGGVSFGQTAPPNPTRGHFWWNGVILQMFDGAAWVQISGVSGAPGTPGAAGAGVTVISTTQPPNPQTGSFWWDGMVLRLWNGTAWIAIGPSGAVAGGLTVETFRMVQITDAVVPSGDIYAIVAFTAQPQVDTQGAWDPTTKRYTPKKAGIYLFTIRGLGSSTVGIVLTKNDTGVLDLNSTPIIAEQFQTAGGAISTEGITPMNGTTDFVRMWGTSTDGALLVLGGGLPMFQAYLLP